MGRHSTCVQRMLTARDSALDTTCAQVGPMHALSAGEDEKKESARIFVFAIELHERLWSFTKSRLGFRSGTPEIRQYPSALVYRHFLRLSRGELGFAFLRRRRYFLHVAQSQGYSIRMRYSPENTKPQGYTCRDHCAVSYRGGPRKLRIKSRLSRARSSARPESPSHSHFVTVAACSPNDT